MFDQLIGKRVILVQSQGNGTSEHWNLTVTGAEGSLVTVEDMQGKIRVINMAAPVNLELREQ